MCYFRKFDLVKTGCNPTFTMASMLFPIKHNKECLKKKNFNYHAINLSQRIDVANANLRPDTDLFCKTCDLAWHWKQLLEIAQ